MSDNTAAKLLSDANLFSLNLLRVEAGWRGEVVKILEDTKKGLVKRLSTEDLTKAKKAELEKFLKGTDDQIKDAYKVIKQVGAENLEKIATISSKQTAKSMSTAIKVGIPTLTAAQLTAVAKGPAIEGSPMEAWWNGQELSTQRRIKGAIQQGIALGEPMEEIRKRIQGTKVKNYKDDIVEPSKREAQAIVRTATQSIANSSRIATIREQGDLVKAIQWSSVLDSRTTIICRALSGKLWDLDLKPIGHTKAFPGVLAHWQCVLASQCIDTHGQEILRGYTRDYVGPFVTIKTAGGKELTVTPNHPILTTKGFVTAGGLVEGGDVISEFVPTKGAIPRSREFYQQHGPALIEEVTGALQESSDFVTVSEIIRGIDFHGDGAEGEVAVISTHRDLGHEAETTLSEKRPQGGFLWADEIRALGAFYRLLLQLVGVMIEPLVRGRTPFTTGLIARYFPGVFHRFGFVADPNVSLPKPTIERAKVASNVGNDRSIVLARLKSFHRDFLGVLSKASSSARGYSGGVEVLPNAVLSEVELAHKILDRDFGEIQADKIISLRRWEGRGRVHNLETTLNFYSAQGIVAGNCRSTQNPVTYSWKELANKKVDAAAAEANPDKPHPEKKKITFEQAFEKHLKAQGFNETEISQIKPNTKASMDGQVSTDLSHDDWLEGKGDAFARKALGPGRYALWKEGKLTLKDLTDQDNRVLTIAQLEAAVDAGGFPPETEGVFPAPAPLPTFFPSKAQINLVKQAEAKAAAEKAEKALADIASGDSTQRRRDALERLNQEQPGLAASDPVQALEIVEAKAEADQVAAKLGAAKEKILAGKKLSASEQATIDGLTAEERSNWDASIKDALAARASEAKLRDAEAEKESLKAIVEELGGDPAMGAEVLPGGIPGDAEGARGGRPPTRSAEEFRSSLNGPQIEAAITDAFQRDPDIGRNLASRIDSMLGFEEAGKGNLRLLGAGGESIVFETPGSDRVTKAVFGAALGRYGFTVEDNELAPATLDQFLERIRLFEGEFKSGIEVEALLDNGRAVIITQPRYDGLAPSPDELISFMEAAGWTPIEEGPLSWTKGDLVASDVKPANAIKLADGTIQAIDFVMTRRK
jgi:SPP1 gp7 family putative phage head morphogenesis protein